ncbi:hypothetical protein ACNFR7_21235 [Streptomyces sp. RM1]|uniref:hypothetical protein n=1 Tax=Streptomyces misionensis TaxID=67331 RepID=UPI00396C028A
MIEPLLRGTGGKHHLITDTTEQGSPRPRPRSGLAACGKEPGRPSAGRLADDHHPEWNDGLRRYSPPGRCTEE